MGDESATTDTTSLDRQDEQESPSDPGAAVVETAGFDADGGTPVEEEAAPATGEVEPTLPVTDLTATEFTSVTAPDQTSSTSEASQLSAPNKVSEAGAALLTRGSTALPAAPPTGPTINQIMFSGQAFYDFFQPAVDSELGDGTWTAVLFDHTGYAYAHELAVAPDATKSLGDVGPTELAKYVYYIVAFAADPAEKESGVSIFDAYHAVGAKELKLGDRGYLVVDDESTHLDYISLVFLWKKTGIPAAVQMLPRTLPKPNPTPPTPPQPDTIAPTAPVVASSTITPTSVKLTPSEGTDNVGVVGYNIYRDGNRVRVNDALIPTGGFVIDFGLDPDSVHFYYARAVDAAGNESPDSRSLRVNTLDAPSVDPDSGWEKNWEIFNTVYGWIPIFGQGLSIVSFAIDSIQLAAALGSGDRAAIIDEIRDLTGSAVGILPFGRLVSEPIENLIDILATLILGVTENAAVPEAQAVNRSATSVVGQCDGVSGDGHSDKCVGWFVLDCGSST